MEIQILSFDSKKIGKSLDGVIVYSEELFFKVEKIEDKKELIVKIDDIIAKELKLKIIAFNSKSKRIIAAKSLAKDFVKENSGKILRISDGADLRNKFQRYYSSHKSNYMDLVL